MPDPRDDETPDPHVRERQQIVAGGHLSPLPSELLESCDGGQGVAAFVLTPDMLDRLPTLTRWPAAPNDDDPHPEHLFGQAGAGQPGESLASQVARLAEFIVDNVPGEPSRSEGAIDTAIRLLRGPIETERLREQLASVIAERDRVRDARVEAEAERDDYRQRLGQVDAEFARRRAQWDEDSRQGREQVERLVASGDDLREQLRATRADQLAVIEERDDARRQLVEQGEAAEEQADALRAEVARLSGLLDEPGAASVTTGPEYRCPTCGVRLTEPIEHEPVELYVPVAASVSWDGAKLRALYLRPHEGEVGSEAYPDGSGRPLLIEDMRQGRADGERPTSITVPDGLSLLRHPVALRVYGEGVVQFDGRKLSVVYEPAVAAQAMIAEHDAHEETSPHPIAEDPRRPRLDHYPEDAVLLTYVEIRKLLALHLEACASAIDGALAAGAMRDGETPLRLAEVLDR